MRSCTSSASGFACRRRPRRAVIAGSCGSASRIVRLCLFAAQVSPTGRDGRTGTRRFPCTRAAAAPTWSQPQAAGSSFLPISRRGGARSTCCVASASSDDRGERRDQRLPPATWATGSASRLLTEVSHSGSLAHSTMIELRRKLHAARSYLTIELLAPRIEYVTALTRRRRRAPSRRPRSRACRPCRGRPSSASRARPSGMFLRFSSGSTP